MAMIGAGAARSPKRMGWPAKVGLALAGFILLRTCQTIGYSQGQEAAQSAPAATQTSAPVVAAVQAAPVPVAHRAAEPRADASVRSDESSNETASSDLTQGCDTTGTLTEDKWDRCQSQIIANLARKNGTSPEVIMRTLNGQ